MLPTPRSRKIRDKTTTSHVNLTFLVKAYIASQIGGAAIQTMRVIESARGDLRR